MFNMYYYYMGVSRELILLTFLIMAVSFVIQVRLKKTFARYNNVLCSRHITGAQAAQMVLRKNGVYDCQIEKIDGDLTDHYDPRSNVIRLSKAVYEGSSVAAVGVAAHEAGHAVQYATSYVPIKLRAAILPAAQLGTNASWLLAFLGVVFSFYPLVYAGVLLFMATTVFHLITLPVELNASRRALQAIGEPDMLDQDEKVGARKVLTMAALTYVAALAMSVVQLLMFIARFTARSRR